MLSQAKDARILQASDISQRHAATLTFTMTKKQSVQRAKRQSNVSLKRSRKPFAQSVRTKKSKGKRSPALTIKPQSERLRSVRKQILSTETLNLRNVERNWSQKTADTRGLPSLGSCCSTIELHPLVRAKRCRWRPCGALACKSQAAFVPLNAALGRNHRRSSAFRPLAR